MILLMKVKFFRLTCAISNYHKFICEIQIYNHWFKNIAIIDVEKYVKKGCYF